MQDLEFLAGADHEGHAVLVDAEDLVARGPGRRRERFALGNSLPLTAAPSAASYATIGTPGGTTLLLAVVVLLPPFALAMMVMNVDWALNSSPWPLVLLLELTVSAVFYLSLSLLCSYYCQNTRTALAVSYTLLALYAVCNFLAWRFLFTPTVNSISNFAYSDQSYGYQPWNRSGALALLSPMEILHLIQSCVLTAGFLTLLALRIRRRRV